MVPASLLRRHALLLGRHDVERQHREHGAVHRHRHAHLVERDAVEQLAHVEDRVDGHARHADVAGDARVVAVVAAVGRQVEGDGQALLAGGEVAPVEGVGLLGRGEPGVLADRPRLVDVHRRVRAAQERRHARVGGEEVEALEVGGGVGAARRCPRASPTAWSPPARPAHRPGVGAVEGAMPGSRGSPWHLQEVEDVGQRGRARRRPRGSCLDPMPACRLAGDEHRRGAGGIERRADLAACSA